MSVKLGRYKYIATQGPCPEGFHIPLTSEWQALCGILTSTFGLASNATTMGTYLKMPAAGYRKYSTSNITNQGTLGRYWSSSRNDVDSAYRLYFSSSSINPQSNDYCTSGYSVRPFYNEGIAPNGGWQVLYQGSGSAGIYWHKDLGLITSSNNGTTWVTIADKNLGATTVYNSGDTLSEENCGGYYQWGNNHMFPWTGTVTTSSTQVDASSYGPGNWYDSSTFITRSSSPYDWSSVRNDNLWGGASGRNIWKDVESIKYEWKPGSNTIAYYEFNDNINDTSGNNRNLSMKNGSFTYGTIGEYKYVNISQSAWTNGLSNFPFDINSNTVSFWIKNPYYTKSDSNAMVADFWRGGSYGTSRLNTYSGAIKIDNVSYTIPDDTKRYHVCIVYDNRQTNLYVNGEYVGANTCGLASGTTSVSFALNNAPDTNSSTYSGQCQMSQLIFESTKRTAQEIVDYYNSTKGTYTGEGGGNDTVNGHSLDEHSMFPQGPCPSGFHVPLNSEWNKIKTVFSSLGILTGGNVCTYLKLAPDGYLNNTGTSKIQSNQYADSWSNYKGSGGTCSKISMCGPNYSDGSYNSRPSTAAGIWSTIGMHIRPFKNFPVKPDSSWTTLYQGSGSAGIFHNASLGLISISSSGVTWVTIADKNLGATTVWDGGTTYNEANCGKFYQWGNNYAFPFSGQSPGSTTQVDASNYGPGNPYSSSTWINTGTTDWDSSHNGDLWGGVSRAELKQYYTFNLLNEYIGEYHECEVNTMGPCPSGFHIPTRQEWHDLYDIGYALGLWNTTNYGRQLQLQFNMPVCGKLNNDGTYTSSPTDAVYWCADKQSSSYGRDLWLRTTTDVATVDDDTTMIRGGSIRPFRNMPLIPTTSDSNWSIPTGSNPANGGIYDNETEGVISISADGAHWMTLADKNCGATTKWYLNSTMSESNCGKFYQWGNNHGFPFTGATKTSSTAVDASGYGPFSEYYDDDTFITTSPWDTSDNRNLWGGVSGPTRNCDMGVIPEPLTFVYTGSDQEWEVPKTGKYLITCKGAGSNTSAGGKGSGVIELTKGTILTIVVGQRGNSQSSATYGFGGAANYGSDRAGGGLSGVFLGAGTVQPTDSARALVIGGGAGGGCPSGGRNGGVGGGEEGGNGGGSNYGTAGGGGTQTGRNSGGNVGANQFNGGNGSGTYGWGGGGGWYGGNSSIGDGSGDDDKGAGGGSGYVIVSAENRLLTAGGGAGVGESGTVYISWYDPEGPATGTDYTMLSLGGEINRYSELTLDGSVNLDNAGTYWNGNVTQTDKAGLYYKVFDSEIIGFNLEGQSTNNNYDGFCLQFGETGDRNGANIKSFNNGFRVEGTSNYYNWSGTGAIVGGQISNGTDTELWKEALNSSTARIYITGTKSQDTWTLNITTSSGQEWTKTITYGNALYAFGCRTGRRFTGQAGQIYKVILTLKD